MHQTMKENKLITDAISLAALLSTDSSTLYVQHINSIKASSTQFVLSH